MHTNMNFVNVDIATVKAANNSALALRKPAMLQRKMGKEP
jgi:hypothetical protein